MASAAKKTYITPEEYLARERLAETKSEYYDGQIYAMSGASRPHILAAGNLFTEISMQFRGRDCEVYSNDMRVLVERTGLYTYPDIVAVCGKPQLLDDELDTLLNPQVIVEVLSPSTEAYDRGKKFAQFQRIESLREYILVAQDQVRVERYSRQGSQWLLTTWDSLDSTLQIESIDCQVRLRVIYDKVVFPEPDRDAES
jgi:Uma2 family endonuclease